MDDDNKSKKGRGHPPREHWFPPGVSGNRFGRPRGSKNKKTKVAGQTSSEKLVLDEARREVQTSDGKMSALQAVYRAEFVAAVKGNTAAQRQITGRIASLEQEERDAQLAVMTNLEECKLLFEAAKQSVDQRQFAKVEATLLPHPDDIEVDFANRTFAIRGPSTTRERKLWNEGMAALADVRRLVFNFRRKLAADPCNEELAYTLLIYTDAFMRNNDRLPERYRLKRLPIWKIELAPAVFSSNCNGAPAH